MKEFTKTSALVLLCLLLPGARAQFFPGSLPANVTKAGDLKHPGLIESSGLAASRRHPGVLWTHNDTESPVFLFAMTREGTHLGAYELQGANPVDLEAIAWHDGFLYLADIGTNGMRRSHSAIYKVTEPDLSERWGPARVDHTWYVRFPGERQDTEGFFIWEGFGYLVSKYKTNGAVALHRFSLADNSESILLEFVGSIPAAGDVSEASLSADGNRLALLTEDGLDIFFVGGNLGLVRAALQREVRLINETLEAGTFVNDGYLATGEFYPDILLFSGPEVSGQPMFELQPLDLTVFEGTAARFSASASGFPAPAYEWRFNGGILPGETNATLVLSNVAPARAGLYEVIARNTAGEARASATLAVLATAADLRITEVLSSPLPGSDPAADWWELTNFGTAPADLGGWRFNDGTGGLDDAFTIPPGVTAQPGESIVFIENLSAAEFKEWWGPERFSAASQIVTYSGAALSFRAAGDSLRLWEASATADQSTFARVDFGQAVAGSSFGYDPAAQLFGEFSQEGVNGAFRAVSGEIASPGRVSNEPGPAAFRLAAERSPQGMRILVSGQAPRAFELEYSDDLKTWRSLGQFPGGSGPLPQTNSAPRRVFRARVF